jgi:colicin import membrane protein
MHPERKNPMTKLLAFKGTGAAALLALVLAACGSEPVRSGEPNAPSPSTSVEQADQRLAAVAKERAAIEARFAAREQECYRKFFVNHCLDEAKEHRRGALAAQRAIEIEAEHFLRKTRVEERERAMAAAETDYREEEARMAAQPPAAPRQATETPPPKPAPVVERMAKHNARVEQNQARQQVEAAKRAANVKAYEERKRESEERQRKVAKRKADKAAKEAQGQGQAPVAGARAQQQGGQ